MSVVSLEYDSPIQRMAVGITQHRLSDTENNSSWKQIFSS